MHFLHFIQNNNVSLYGIKKKSLKSLILNINITFSFARVTTPN